MKQRKTPALMTGYNIRTLALAAFAASGLLLCGCGDEPSTAPAPTSEEQTAIDKACATAEKSIGTHAEAIRQAVLAKKEKSREVAEKLTGYKAAWVYLTDGEEALKQKSQAIVEADLISKEWGDKLIGQEVAGFIIDLRDAEDVLARETGCATLSVAPDSQHATDGTPVNAQRLDVKDGIQKQMYTELTALIGAEAATQLIVSSGILGTSAGFSWSTLGISLGVGLVVDIVVRWIMDPSEKVALQLNAALDEAAETQAEAFRTAMKKHLDARRTRWIEELSKN